MKQQLPHCGYGVDRVGRVVTRKLIDGLATNPAVGVDVGDCQLGSLDETLPGAGEPSGEWEYLTDVHLPNRRSCSRAPTARHNRKNHGHVGTEYDGCRSPIHR